MKIIEIKKRRLLPSTNSTGDEFVGIDCLALPRVFSGAAYFIHHFTLALLAAERDFSVAVLCKPVHAQLFARFLKPGDKIVPIPLKNRLHQLLHYEYQLPELLVREKIIIFHAMHYITPPRSMYYRTVTTFHDMGFFLYPEYYPLIKQIYFSRRIPAFMFRSDVITAVSESTRKSIIEIFPDSQAKIRVINPGLDHLKSQALPQTGNKFILAVNAFEKRKNIPFVIKLFNLLKHKYNFEHQLILIGSPGNDSKNIHSAIKHSSFRNDIHVLSSVSSDELSGYYTEADFFINASGYEGFGFTPFEAIRLRCPAFIYNNNVTRTLFGQHKYLFNHIDAAVWADCIVHEMKTHFANRIRESLVAHLTWNRTAEQALLLYSGLLKKEGILVA